MAKFKRGMLVAVDDCAGSAPHYVTRIGKTFVEVSDLSRWSADGKTRIKPEPDGNTLRPWTQAHQVARDAWYARNELIDTDWNQLSAAFVIRIVGMVRRELEREEMPF
jgi:hypothetical protein